VTRGEGKKSHVPLTTLDRRGVKVQWSTKGPVQNYFELDNEQGKKKKGECPAADPWSGAEEEKKKKGGLGRSVLSKMSTVVRTCCDQKKKRKRKKRPIAFKKLIEAWGKGERVRRYARID